MKKLLVVTLVLVVCTIFLTACGSSSPTPTGPATTSPVSTVASKTTPPLTTTASIAPTSAAPTTTAAKPGASTPAAPTLSKYGGILKTIEARAPGTPIGVIWETAAANPCMQVSMEPLFKEQIDGTLDPLLATSYEYDTSITSPSITLRFRKGIKFQDGTDFNAQAAKWNFEQEKTSAGGAGGTRYWKSFDIIDDYTVKVNLTQYRNSIMPFYATNSLYMVSPTAMEKNGIEWLRWHMVGTGPFTQTDFQRDVSLTAARNANYWNTGKPYLDGVQYLFVADEMTRLALFKSGGADVLNTNSNGRVALDLQSQGFKLASQINGIFALIPDGGNSDSPWANAKARMAVEHAIDKEAIARTFGYGFNQAAYQMPSPKNKAFVPTLEGRKYDTAKAKQLLTEAGFPNGFKSKIIAPNTADRNIIVALQSYLDKVGIQVELEFPEPAKYNEYQTISWKNALLFATIGENANYNVTFGYMLGIPLPNFKSMKQPTNWPELYNAVMLTPQVDPKLQQKAIQAVYDEATLLPMLYTSDIWALKSSVQDTGYGTRSRSSWNPEDAWLSK
jgi:peptide/nickel transport system substrate-binding protein